MAEETLREQLQAVREDVAYIKGRIDTALPSDHEPRIQRLERRNNGLIVTAIAALMAAFGIHLS